MRVLFSLQWVQPLLGNRYVAQIDQYSEISFDDIVGYASKASNINESNMRMAMDAIFDAMQYYVTEGHSVELPYLGTFSFGVNGKATYSAEDAQDAAKLVYRKKINFLPSEQLRALLSSTKVEIVVDDNNREESTDANVTSVNYYHRTLRNQMRKVTFMAGEKFIVQGANLYGGTLEATGYDAQGTETVQSLPLVQTTKIRYEAEPTECVGFSKVEVKDANSNVIVSYNIMKAAGEPYLEAAVLGTLTLQSSITNTIPAGSGAVGLSLHGYKPAELSAKLDGTDIEWDTVTDDACYAEVVIGSTATLVVGSTTFNIARSAAAAAINTMTANGISVGNGQSTEVILGNTYNIVAAGTNLAGITSDMIGGPFSVSNFAASASQITFTIIPTTPGSLSIGDLFSISLTEAPASPIRSISGITNGGTYETSADPADMMIIGDCPQDAVIQTNGTGSADFTGGKEYIRISNFTQAGIQVNIMQGSTTIFSITVRKPSN